MAVLDPNHVNVETGEIGPDLPCKECDGNRHPASLWSRRQTRFLDYDDLVNITQIAERAGEVARHRPFSEADTPPSTEPSAATGESIPEPN
jgi:hypothetical protein